MSETMTLTGEDAQFHSKLPEPSYASAEYDYKDVTIENCFTFLDNAYKGTGGFKDGSYLIPHKRELWYATRRKFSYYVNFVKPIIRSMVEPVFTMEAARQTDSDVLEAFLNNVDNRGTHIQDFTYMAVNVCRRHSICFVVVDNFPEQPAEMQTALQGRMIPYCYVRKANQLYDYDLDTFGNVNMLMFLETPATYTSTGQIKDKTQYRKWTRTYTELYINENEIVGMQNQAPKYVPVAGSRKDHNLGIVPVAVIRDIELEQVADFIPEPRLYDLARVNHALYNKDSEIRELERNQAFAVFCVNQDRSTSLSIGTNNVLFYPIGANPPQYVSPDMNILAQLITDRKELREDLYRLAEQNGVVAVQEASSGIALAYNFFAHKSILEQTATIAEILENKIVDLVNKWMNMQYEYTVKYSKDFVPHGQEARIAMYDKVLLQSPPELMKKKIFIEEYKELFPESDPTEIDDLEAEINGMKQVIDEAAGRGDGGNLPDDSTDDEPPADPSDDIPPVE